MSCFHYINLIQLYNELIQITFFIRKEFCHKKEIRIIFAYNFFKSIALDFSKLLNLNCNKQKSSSKLFE